MTERSGRGGDEILLARLLRLAGARPEHRVCVAGPDGICALLALYRLGFEEACCIGGEGCAACGEAPCDVLLVTGAPTRERLAACAPRLKSGGVLAAVEAGLDQDTDIEAALAAEGREVGWRVHDMADGCLVAMQVMRACVPPVARAA